MRNLILVLGDQLDAKSSVFDNFDPIQDAVWMAETAEETTHVWCHKLRIAYFLSAMRHFREELQSNGRRVYYHQLAKEVSGDQGTNFAEILQHDLAELKPETLVVVEPGDFRVCEMLESAAVSANLPLEIRQEITSIAVSKTSQRMQKVGKVCCLNSFIANYAKNTTY